MSEYQYVGFRAIDGPLTEDELEYAESQSSRAEITKWSFDNEYHYGNFHGDADELLRRGFDVHVQYSSYGIRRVAIRLPDGFPVPKATWSPYVDGERVTWQPDKRGKGGILTVSPFLEVDSLEQIWNVHEHLNALAGIRNELIEGDLRVLYAVWLCGCQDGNHDPADVVEPPIPSGLDDASQSVHALLEFYDQDPLLLKAANEAAPAAVTRPDRNLLVADWVKALPAAEARATVQRFLTEDAASVKTEIFRTVRQQTNTIAWPVAVSSRTLEQLLNRTYELRTDANAAEDLRIAAENKRIAAEQEKQRQKKMKQMVEDPAKWLQHVDQCVKLRGRDNYEAAAQTLADLSEAIGGVEGPAMATEHAMKIKKTNPTLTMLTSALKKKGLLDKTAKPKK